MIKILQASLNSIFDLYNQKDKSYFNFSFFFVVYSSILTFFISLIVFYFADSIYSLHLIRNITGFDLIYRTSALMYGFTVVTMGLYAIYLGETLNDKEDQPSIKSFMKTITKSDWNKFFIITGLLMFFYLITFEKIFEGLLMEMDETYTPLSGELYGDGYGIQRWNKFLIWLDSFVELIKKVVPFIAAGFLVVWHKYPAMTTDILKKFASFFMLILIVSFFVEAISDSLILYTKTYIINLVSIPFKVELVKYFLNAVVTILIAAYFYPAFAAAFWFPVSQRDEEIEKNPEAESEYEELM